MGKADYAGLGKTLLVVWVFGIFLSICFWVFHGLRSVWKTTVFVLVSIAAASLAGGTAILLNGSLGYDRTHLREIIVGGYVGAFVILFAAMTLLFPRTGLWRSIVKSILWATAGSVFAVIGTAASSSFHAVRMRLAPGRPDSDVSLLLAWQVGMAVVLAFLAWTEKNIWVMTRYELRLPSTAGTTRNNCTARTQ